MQNPKTPENSINVNKKRPIGFIIFEAGIEFAVIIGLPLYLLILLGKWLDNKYNQKFFVIICLFTALGLSSYIIYKKINSYKELIK